RRVRRHALQRQRDVHLLLHGLQRRPAGVRLPVAFPVAGDAAMHPVLLELPGLGVRILSAPVLLVAGWAAALWLAPHFGERLHGIDAQASRRACVLLGVAALLGGRLMFVAGNPAAFAAAPWRALAIWEGGRNAGGAVAALLVAGPLVMRAY